MIIKFLNFELHNCVIDAERVYVGIICIIIYEWLSFNVPISTL